MAREIRVTGAWNFKAHDSLAAATRASVRCEENERSLELINGAIVQSYQFYGDFLSIEFSTNKYLNIWPGVNRVNWSISDKPSHHIGSPPEDLLTLIFADGEKTDWNWKFILDSFVGKQAAISPSDQCLFIFYRNGVEYMIDALIEVDHPSKKILFISES